ncbi:AN1-type zinc finger protein 4-like protein [Dinothrombium tinctorium]|uniref:AN1-type zinc finger protein 4-like protein n=1 Tax=Dinothrombium tinctorium TaxID=1965070 RepID=A0A3S3PR31_9ACAR|nr:AN1-type zinc finger protein 4-like protein [Dinothrombium tinctorium]RWS15714.1 AN1-type zinc finger protein 4-like protein [Dinothrombium tinctorium]
MPETPNSNSSSASTPSNDGHSISSRSQSSKKESFSDSGAVSSPLTFYSHSSQDLYNSEDCEECEECEIIRDEKPTCFNERTSTNTISSSSAIDSPSRERETFFTTHHRSVNQIPIYIETLTGTTFEMQIMSQETIYAVKFKLQVEEGIPVNQQHLIWQGEELKDEFSLDEYGIGFGAILRLVIGLRGGPLTESPLTTAQIKESTVSTAQECESNHAFDSTPLTVLIFQNGDNIKMYTINTTNTDSASNSWELQNTSSSTENNMLSGSRNASAKSNKTKRTRTDREIENENLRIKIDELQRRMRSLSIRKNKKMDEINSVNLEQIKLPTIEDQKKISKSSTKTKFNRQTPIHLPSIKPSANNNCSKSNQELESLKPTAFASLQKSTSKCSLNSTDSLKLVTAFRQTRTRSNSLSPKSILAAKAQSIQKFKELSTTSSIAEAPSETSVCGSVACIVPLPKRPQTTPFVGNVAKMHKESSVKELQAFAGSKRLLLRKQSALLLTKRQADKKSLPPVIKSSEKKLAVRCFLCKKRLGLASRYKCRCGSLFCPSHRYSEAHDCSYDYRSEGKQILQLNNPLIRATKLPKI